MSKHPELIAAIEAKAKDLGIEPSTVGRQVGQGGKFYARLLDGARVWPETEATVLARLSEMQPSKSTSSAA